MADFAGGQHGWDDFQTPNARQPDVSMREARGTIARLTSLVGGAISFMLLLAAGVWAYNLLSRDVSGVPVVRAVEGPMRVQPEDPGGEAADHQGLAVNAIAALGTAEDPADTLILAPAPLDLRQSDAPLAALSSNTLDPDRWDHVVDPDSAGNLLDELRADDDTSDLRAPETPERLQQASLGAQPRTARDAGLSRSPVPPVRPRDLAARRADPAPAQTEAAADEIAAQALPSGTQLAQIGAFDSPEIARAEWTRMSGKFSDYMNGKQRVIERAVSGGRVFYRLRVAGFDDRSAVRRFCASLKAQQAQCIPASAR